MHLYEGDRQCWILELLTVIAVRIARRHPNSPVDEAEGFPEFPKFIVERIGRRPSVPHIRQSIRVLFSNILLRLLYPRRIWNSIRWPNMDFICFHHHDRQYRSTTENEAIKHYFTYLHIGIRVPYNLYKNKRNAKKKLLYLIFLNVCLCSISEQIKLCYLCANKRKARNVYCVCFGLLFIRTDMYI